MRRTIALAIPAVTAAIAIRAWRRNPRMGTALVNTVVNPLLLRRGLAGGARSEIGTLEHVGRVSGVSRLTLVHPEPTPDGFRVLVPLGGKSQWARNVLAAGHCRMHLHDQVFDLDEPAMVSAAEAADLPWLVRRLMAAVGLRYIRLHTFAVNGDSDGSEVLPEPLEDASEPGRVPAVATT
jgi:deazaflavin-dependent oxidoreductase (nitroreductase family)